MRQSEAAVSLHLQSESVIHCEVSALSSVLSSVLSSTLSSVLSGLLVLSIVLPSFLSRLTERSLPLASLSGLSY